MPTTEIDICNQALGFLGAKRIASFEDGTNEARLCADNYGPLRDAVLEERRWTHADASLTLTAPTEGDWGNGELKYLLPSEVLIVYRAYRDVSGSRPTQLGGWRREGRYIVVRFDGDIYIKATVRNEDIDTYTPGFIQSLAARLAADLAIPITRSRQLQSDMWNLYSTKLRDAAAADSAQGRSERTDSTELVGARYVDGLAGFVR